VAIAGGRQSLNRVLVHVGRGVVVRQDEAATANLAAQRGRRLHGQGVAGQVMQTEVEGSLQRVAPGRQRLAGQAEDQVAADGGDASL